MKKLVYTALLLGLIFSLTACGKDKDDSSADASSEAKTTEVSESDSSEEVDEKNVEETNDSNPQELFSESEDQSVLVTIPNGWATTEHMAKTWLGYTKADESGDGTITLSLYMKDEDPGNLEETFNQEINYTASANSDSGSATISDVTETTAGDLDVSYFNYNYGGNDNTTDGCRIWTTLPNGCVLIMSVEDVGPNTTAPDAESYINEILTTVTEN